MILSGLLQFGIILEKGRRNEIYMHYECTNYKYIIGCVYFGPFCVGTMTTLPRHEICMRFGKIFSQAIRMGAWTKNQCFRIFLNHFASKHHPCIIATTYYSYVDICHIEKFD